MPSPKIVPDPASVPDLAKVAQEIQKCVGESGYGDYPCLADKKSQKNIFYIVVYILIIVTLIIVGGLYEGKVIKQTKQHTQDSEWIYGLIILPCMLLLLFLSKWVIWKFVPVSDNCNSNAAIKYFWCFSHMLTYFTLAFVAPGQWPFWLAIGVAWEWFECYRPICMKKGFTSCNGMSDIIANLAGISIAMWIRSEVDVKQLERSQSPFKVGK